MPFCCLIKNQLIPWSRLDVKEKIDKPARGNFLKEVKKEEFDPETVEKYGQNDLQLEETSNIMKDLILLLTPKGEVAAAAALN